MNTFGTLKTDLIQLKELTSMKPGAGWFTRIVAVLTTLVPVDCSIVQINWQWAVSVTV
jgi:hypothetical protein